MSDNLLDVNRATTARKSAEERREDVLQAAREVFAHHGLSGASTDEIARRAGISQPYLFRLFRTKKELFLAAVERCFSETRDTFEQAAEGKTGDEALREDRGEVVATRSAARSSNQSSENPSWVGRWTAYASGTRWFCT